MLILAREKTFPFGECRKRDRFESYNFSAYRKNLTFPLYFMMMPRCSES